MEPATFGAGEDAHPSRTRRGQDKKGAKKNAFGRDALGPTEQTARFWNVDCYREVLRAKRRPSGQAEVGGVPRRGGKKRHRQLITLFILRIKQLLILLVTGGAFH